MSEHKTLLELVTEVVNDTAPDELAGLEQAVEAHTARPPAARAVGRGETLGSGAMAAEQLFSTLVIAIGIDLAKEMVVVGVRAAYQKSSSSRRTTALRRRLTFWRRAEVTPDTALPPVPEPDKPVLAERLTEIALDHNATRERAATAGSAVADAWPTTSTTAV